MDTLDELWNEEELEKEIDEEYLKELEEETEAEEDFPEFGVEESFEIIARGRPTGDRPDD